MTMTQVSNRARLIAAAAVLCALPASSTMSEPKRTAVENVPAPYGVQQMPCGKRLDVVRMLREQFGESPIAHGLADSGAVAEVFISSNGTWTIVATSPNGTTCMVGSGRSWQPVVARDDTI
jgi:hypothetical protein